MKHDVQFDVATGAHAGSKIWKNGKILWSQFVQRLSQEHKTAETFKEYLAMSKDDQSKIKDIGGYVGGYLRGGRRNLDTIQHRQLLTLDIDFAHLDFWEDFLIQFGNAAVLHGTHKHHETSPRYRLLIPLDREVTPDEYSAISRRVAGVLDVELFDNTTFEVNRLMFWPSNPKDIDYYFRFQDAPIMDADEILGQYTDWTDSTLWPTAQKQLDHVRSGVLKQEDPANKSGIVGAFCRTHSIEDVIEKHLKDTYTDAKDGRYTYVHGSTAAGLITYDGKFAYSHHGTDPISGKLCNAFDLVRIHKFGHLDTNAAKPVSYKKMQHLAQADPEVKKLIATENVESSAYDFADIELTEEIEVDWMVDLEINNQGKYVSSAPNLNLIFSHDARLKGLFRQNHFDGKKYIYGNMPWRKITTAEPIKDVDYSGVRNYLETIYGINGSLKIDDAMALEFEKNGFNPVLDYLRELKWDGTPRVDNLLIDYFGADDNIYSREAIRKTLVAAVARIYVPGIKFDLVLTIVGNQGCGKSSFIGKLGKQWFSDTFMTVHGKEALEQIQGAWIIEMAELSGLRKAETEAIKHFISKQEDMFRPAYARTSQTYKRQCVFIGTTNDKDFLRDPTGNRRFIPVDTSPVKAKKSIWGDLDQDIDQIWAEAVHMFKNGEKLFMSEAADKLAVEEQEGHSEVDDRMGLVKDYLDKLLPEDWDDLDLSERRIFLNDPLTKNGTIERDYVCVAEVWAECLGYEKEAMDRYKTKDINNILRTLPGWERSKSTKSFKIYGTQKYYSKSLI